MWQLAIMHMQGAELGTAVQGGAEAKIPFVFRLEAVNVLQLVVEGAGQVEGDLGKAQRLDGCLLFWVVVVAVVSASSTFRNVV